MIRRSTAPAILMAALLGAITACRCGGDERPPGEAGEQAEAARSEATGGGELAGEPDSEKATEVIVRISPEAAARIDVEVAPVTRRTLAGVIHTTGRVDFNQDRLAHISPRVPGRAHQIEVTLGDRVRAGQTLVVIDSIELGRAKSAFLRARAQLDLARQTLERDEGLLADRITSEQSVLEARSARARALAAVQAARQELRLLGLSNRQIDAARAGGASAALLSLTSPVDGTIVDKHVSLGEMVSPGSNLFTVVDLSEVWIWIDVYERDLARVHLQDGAAALVEAFPGRVFEGKIGFIRSQVDPDTRTARARIDVANPDGALRPGMFATVTVTDPHGADGEVAPAALVVPTSALQRDGDRSVVFVDLGDGRYGRRVVTLGRRTDGYAEVTSGLSAEDEVVIKGAFILKSEAHKHLMGGDED